MGISMGQGPPALLLGTEGGRITGCGRPSQGVRTGRRRQALAACQVPGTNHGFAPSQFSLEVDAITIPGQVICKVTRLEEMGQDSGPDRQLVPGPARGDTTTGSCDTPPGWLGRGQVGSVAFGVMGTATCRSQEVRDKCWRQEFRPIPRAEVCLTLASVHGLCARTTAFAALEVLPKALQRGKNHLPLGMRRLRASPWPPHAAREAGGTEALGLSALPP